MTNKMKMFQPCVGCDVDREYKWIYRAAWGLLALMVLVCVLGSEGHCQTTTGAGYEICMDGICHPPQPDKTPTPIIRTCDHAWCPVELFACPVTYCRPVKPKSQQPHPIKMLGSQNTALDHLYLDTGDSFNLENFQIRISPQDGLTVEPSPSVKLTWREGQGKYLTILNLPLVGEVTLHIHWEPGDIAYFTEEHEARDHSDLLFIIHSPSIGQSAASELRMFGNGCYLLDDVLNCPASVGAGGK